MIITSLNTSMEQLGKRLVSLETGSYELNSINKEIHRQMKVNGDYDNVSNSFI